MTTEDALPGAWQPIESAPMDGTPVLVWLPEPMLRSHVHQATLRPNLKIVGGHFVFDLPSRPTHWMPQPPPPGSTALAALTLVQAERDELQREVSGLHAAADQFLDERDTARQAYADACKCLTAVNGERDAMQQERDELRTLLTEALSICSSVSTERSRRVVRDECAMYLQTEEWCKWLEDELAPKFHAALIHRATPTPEASEASRGRSAPESMSPHQGA